MVVKVSVRSKQADDGATLPGTFDPAAVTPACLRRSGNKPSTFQPTNTTVNSNALCSALLCSVGARSCSSDTTDRWGGTKGRQVTKQKGGGGGAEGHHSALRG